MLGLLALRPFTPYELNQQIERGLKVLWPTSERTVYSEPKRLEELGWATSTRRPGGGRAATVFRITDDGRAALEAWLASPVSEPPLNSEMLLRVMHADHGSKADLVAAVQGAVQQWRKRFNDEIPILREYLDDGGLFPDRLHLVGLLVGFVDRYVMLVEDFANEVAAEAARWDEIRSAGLTPHAKRTFTATVRRHSAGNDL